MFRKKNLLYGYFDLEPFMDTSTVETHYENHYEENIKRLNDAMKNAGFESENIEELFQKADSVKNDYQRSAIIHFAGNFYNHSLFFDILSPEGGGVPTGSLLKKIEKCFGCFSALKTKITLLAATQFGSGWIWISVNKDGDLRLESTPNYENPLYLSKGEWTPIFALDMWEHAYYLKYKNKRCDYIRDFFQVVDWKKIEKRYEACTKKALLTHR